MHIMHTLINAHGDALRNRGKVILQMERDTHMIVTVPTAFVKDDIIPNENSS